MRPALSALLLLLVFVAGAHCVAALEDTAESFDNVIENTNFRLANDDGAPYLVGPDSRGFNGDTTRFERASANGSTLVYDEPAGIQQVTVRFYFFDSLEALSGSWSLAVELGDGSRRHTVVSLTSADAAAAITNATGGTVFVMGDEDGPASVEVTTEPIDGWFAGQLIIDAARMAALWHSCQTGMWVHISGGDESNFWQVQIGGIMLVATPSDQESLCGQPLPTGCLIGAQNPPSCPELDTTNKSMYIDRADSFSPLYAALNVRLTKTGTDTDGDGHGYTRRDSTLPGELTYRYTTGGIVEIRLELAAQFTNRATQLPLTSVHIRPYLEASCRPEQRAANFSMLDFHPMADGWERMEMGFVVAPFPMLACQLPRFVELSWFAPQGAEVQIVNVKLVGIGEIMGLEEIDSVDPPPEQARPWWDEDRILYVIWLLMFAIFGVVVLIIVFSFVVCCLPSKGGQPKPGRDGKLHSLPVVSSTAYEHTASQQIRPVRVSTAQYTPELNDVAEASNSQASSDAPITEVAPANRAVRPNRSAGQHALPPQPPGTKPVAGSRAPRRTHDQTGPSRNSQRTHNPLHSAPAQSTPSADREDALARPSAGRGARNPLHSAPAQSTELAAQGDRRDCARRVRNAANAEGSKCADGARRGDDDCQQSEQPGQEAEVDLTPPPSPLASDRDGHSIELWKNRTESPYKTDNITGMTSGLLPHVPHPEDPAEDPALPSPTSGPGPHMSQSYLGSAYSDSKNISQQVDMRMNNLRAMHHRSNLEAGLSTGLSTDDDEDDDDESTNNDSTEIDGPGMSTGLADKLQPGRLEVFDTRMLGRGGFGTVFMGELEGQRVAVKVIKLPEAWKIEACEKVYKEYAIAGSLLHENVVRTLQADVRPLVEDENDADTSEWTGLVSFLSNQNFSNVLERRQKIVGWQMRLVMEYCSLGSLKDHLKAKRSMVNGRPRVLDVVNIALDVARGCRAVHRKRVIHGDLKPHNVLLTPRHNEFGFVAKLGDFGMASRFRAGVNSGGYVSGVQFGTPGYVAPEVIQAQQMYTSTDAYAFGILLWELWHSQIYYELYREAQQTKNKAELLRYRPSFSRDCPVSWQTIATRCWAYDHAARPAFDNIVRELNIVRKDFQRNLADDGTLRPGYG